MIGEVRMVKGERGMFLIWATGKASVSRVPEGGRCIEGTVVRIKFL